MTTHQTDTRPKNTAKKPFPAPLRPAIAPQRAKPGRKAEPAKKAAHSSKDGTTARRGSKTAKVLELLKRSRGVTLKEIMKATAWQPHSVRGFVSGTLRKKLGIRIESFKRDDNERTYCIASN